MSACGTKQTRAVCCICLLSGVKRTCRFALHMSAFDPKRTCAARKNRGDFCPLLVALPYLVTDFLGDHSIADMEIVQQSHLHLGADGERAILEAITRDAKRRPHVVEDAVGRCEALDRVKGDPLGGVEHAQIHVLDRLPPSIANVASGRLPDGILGIKLDAFIDAVAVTISRPANQSVINFVMTTLMRTAPMPLIRRPLAATGNSSAAVSAPPMAISSKPTRTMLFAPKRCPRSPPGNAITVPGNM